VSHQLVAGPSTDGSFAAGRERKGRLLQVLGVAFGVAVIIGNTIGAGIMRTPSDIAGWLPSPALFLGVWVAGGLYALLGAANMAEMGVLIPRSGGQYVFAHYTFGAYAGFVIGWTDWISTCASVAAVSIVIGEYARDLAPGAFTYASLTASVVVLFFAWVQWRGIIWGDRTQQLTSFLKTLLFAGLIVAAFVLTPQSAAVTAAGTAVVTAAGTAVVTATGTAGVTISAFVLAMQAVIYTYDGWNGVLYFSEETRDPTRDIPRSMLSGVVSVILIYVLINFAFLHVLGIAGMRGNNFAAGAAARAIFGQRGDVIIRMVMIASMLSCVNALVLMGTRVPYAMSRDGLFPSAATRVSERGTPTLTLLLTVIVSVALIVTGTFERAIAIAAFFFVLQYVSTFSAIFVLRRREPNRPRPYRAPGYPYTTALVWVGGVTFLIGAVVQDWTNSRVSLGLLALSAPVFWLTRSRSRAA
jgi:APA family basic amino acid/polyamine antiporter